MFLGLRTSNSLLWNSDILSPRVGRTVRGDREFVLHESAGVCSELVKKTDPRTGTN